MFQLLWQLHTPLLIPQSSCLRNAQTWKSGGTSFGDCMLPKNRSLSLGQFPLMLSPLKPA